MMPTFPGSKVIFTDTDSLCYMIPNENNVYEKIKESKRFDFSNFPEDHPNYSKKYYLIPGKFKDECPESIIVEIVGHRSKMYSILKIDGGNKKAANGVCSHVKHNIITHEDYRESLLENVVMEHKQCRIEHKSHTLMTVNKYKKSLCPFNDKRWIQKNGDDFETFSFGHWRLKGNFKFVL